MCVLDKVKGYSSSMGNVAPDEELNKIRSFQNSFCVVLSLFLLNTVLPERSSKELMVLKYMMVRVNKQER